MSRTRRTGIEKAFGAAVRSLRRKKEISQEGLADKAGLHRTYVGDIERGVRNVGLVNIAKLASALEVNLRELMSEVERQLERNG